MGSFRAATFTVILLLAGCGRSDGVPDHDRVTHHAVRRPDPREAVNPTIGSASDRAPSVDLMGYPDARRQDVQLMIRCHRMDLGPAASTGLITAAELAEAGRLADDREGMERCRRRFVAPSGG